MVLLARRPESVDEIVTEIKKAGGEAVGVATDLTDPQSVKSAFEKIKTELPDTKLAAAVYNVSSGFVRKPFLEQKLEDLQAGLAGSAYAAHSPCFPKPGLSLVLADKPTPLLSPPFNSIGFFNFAQATIPLLLEAVPESKYPPTLIATGATASIKGSANFGTFAAGKFALRALTQSLAREFGPKGVHVAHAIIDGVIAGPRTAGFTVNGGAPDGKLDPDAVSPTDLWHSSRWLLMTFADCGGVLGPACPAPVRPCL